MVDHELCLAPLNLELPPFPAEVSLGCLIEDDLVVQPDGDIGEVIGDVTGHHCAAASRHRQYALGAVSNVPACVEKMITRGQSCRTVAGCSCRPWAANQVPRPPRDRMGYLILIDSEIGTHCVE